jgi:cytochrome c oxidase subunit 2
LGWNSWWRRRSLPAALSLAALALAGCGRYAQSTFTPQGTVARVELQLFDLALWVVIPIGLLVGGLLIYILVRFRARPGDDGVPPQIEGNHRLEVGWTVAFVLILAVLAVPNLRDQFLVGDLPAQAADPLHVTVTGHQFWWAFDYTDPGTRVVTANELHVPVGRPVDLALRSADVIHAFWVPELGGKTDVIPGRTNHMWLEAAKPGVYDGQCAEFCGVSHANMRLQVVAQEPADFARWVAHLRHPDVTPRTPLAAQGQQIVLTTCSSCHTVDGTSARGTVGPNLTGVGSRLYIAAGTLRNTDANLARWLRDPQAVKPGALMPDLHLSQAQIDALVAYLRGLK